MNKNPLERGVKRDGVLQRTPWEELLTPVRQKVQQAMQDVGPFVPGYGQIVLDSVLKAYLAVAHEYKNRNILTDALSYAVRYAALIVNHSENVKQKANETAVNGSRFVNEQADALVNIELGDTLLQFGEIANKKLSWLYQGKSAEDRTAVQDFYRQLLAAYSKAIALSEQINEYNLALVGSANSHAPFAISDKRLDIQDITNKIQSAVAQYEQITGDNSTYARLKMSDFATRRLPKAVDIADVKSSALAGTSN